MAASPGALQRLLGAYDAGDFLRQQFGEDMLHIAAAPDRWNDLFSWTEVNRVLNDGLVAHPRIRLVKGGVELDAALYTYERAGRRWPDSARCQDQMGNGATLILETIDGVTPALDTFVRGLERDLQASIHVDVVATCVPMPGLNVHWDTAECFNLQLAGEKQWQVVRPDRPYPLKATKPFPHREDIVEPRAPASDPTWTGVVTAGDLIYLPRGWWHVVTPVVTPSLHLSVAVDLPTLSDFVRWFARSSAHHDAARRSLRTWESAAARETRLREDLATLAASLQPELVEAYLEELRSSAVGRVDFALPHAAQGDGMSLTPDAVVRRRSTTPMSWAIQEGKMTIEEGGRTYRADARLEPVVRKLATTAPISVQALTADVPPIVVKAFLLAMLKAGMLTLTDRRPPPCGSHLSS
jgi:hypothetical protein